MMLLSSKHILLFIILYISRIESSAKNYGKFDARLNDAKGCKGPKRKDCGNTTITMLGSSSISCNLLVGENMTSIKGKVIGSLDNKEVMKIHITKVCDHIFFMPIFKAIFKMTDNCILVKNNYTFTMNLAEVMNKYRGTAYMFGNWTYKATFYNDDCNLTCGIFQMAVTPKETT